MTAPSPEVFEKLASFYLGRHYDLKGGKLKDDLLMYDAKDLCTHAMCVGMTGSGKTGLCLSLLEEAAIDGIPAICVDPKGDLGNLLLTFPDMQPEDFKPWLEENEASRKGKTLDELAADTAATWKKGLASWGQTPERVAKFKESVDIAIYTPGSNTGLPMTVLKSFDAPPREILDDSDAMRERVTGAASGLLTLMGIDADPLLSREHILIASIFNHCWIEGKNVTIGDLIGLIQSPPIERVGVLDLDSFMSASDRSKLAMTLNNLLASPAFSTWLEGEPVNIQKMLYTPEGKPRLTILSIAHLTDNERMFFVTILLNELLAWVRTQSGTSSLRAMFYMDEVAGYFPPVANPPSKPPMLTLLKQARAFGLGITLATQNPVDLDYKGLSNIGTWFLGRLQTERDKARVLEGLEGAAIQSGQAFDRNAMEQILAGLGSRVFLLNNVHDDGPSIFQTRWAMSFLAGPLARNQISRLMADRKAKMETSGKLESESLSGEPAAPTRPVVPSGIQERFMVPTEVPDENAKLVYRPGIYSESSLHFVRSSANLDTWIDVKRAIACGRGVPDDLWESSCEVSVDTEWSEDPDEDYTFSELPTDLMSSSKFKSFEKQFKSYLYRHHAMTIYKSGLLKEYAPGGLTEQEARNHFKHAAREALDRETEKLRNKYAVKMERINSKMQTAQDRVDREAEQYKQAKMSSVISFGASILGAFMGNKVASRTNVSKMSTAMRGAGRAAQQKGDVMRAEEQLKQLALDIHELDDELNEDLEKLGEEYRVEDWTLETTTVPPRKSDLKVDDPWLIWTPWQVDSTGIASPLFSWAEKE
ncbi:ATP-binding protein [Rubripirellula amarantea]|uniref:AAA-like domain protein n=1 Tax=Rubripirellula amarantea TaxID=2527999 RepID=A0A5C5WVG8_9BACT|nr:ATP-binding protein [Rubripirellula amarantea]MDA8744229.1 ATP-binding protein [Rubripirellula amarantea]TWT54249.1 AAA-like domain protein [Rubripirellula amarantea]